MNLRRLLATSVLIYVRMLVLCGLFFPFIRRRTICASLFVVVFLEICMDVLSDFRKLPRLGTLSLSGGQMSNFKKLDRLDC